MSAAMLGNDHVRMGLSEENLIRNSSRPRGVSKPAFSINDLKAVLIARGPSTSRIEGLSS
jgi:hypothetical protein